MHLGVDLDAEVRRVDPDRWLASRFVAAGQARDDLIALYAFDHELIRAGSGGLSPGVGAVRLAWWREAIEQSLAGGSVPSHPVTAALVLAIDRRRLPYDVLESIIETRIAALESSSDAVDAAWAFAQATEGRLAELAALVLGAGDRADAARPAGTVWGLMLARRAGATAGPELERRLVEALIEARSAARRLTPSAFPAVLPASLARLEADGRQAGPLVKRWRLTAAALSGRL